jgi:D-beta-D-heptose 7-phosphate kinase / D-beta-D-heptose 1-phosphate adenosyltransferase
MKGLLDHKNKTVIVVGDIILDKYVYGVSSRISPEAPAPIINEERVVCTLGGAANVAKQVADLGINVDLIGFYGDDEYSKIIDDLLDNIKYINGILVKDGSTIIKERIIANNQQLVRIDRGEPTHWTNHQILNDFIGFSISSSEIGAIIVADYCKGTLADSTIELIIKKAKELNIPIFVDTKSSNITKYKGVFAITPNFSEWTSIYKRMSYDKELSDTIRNEINYILITCGKDGVKLFNRELNELVHIKSIARQVFDVTGAGDTLIATFAVANMCGYDIMESANIANIAAGIVVEKQGTATVRLSELFKRSNKPKDKIMSPEDIIKISNGSTIVFANGCFDILHLGHMSLLEQAAKLGDILVVGINSDNSLLRIKNRNSIYDEISRSEMVASLPYVNYVTIFDEETPKNIMDIINPHYVVKGDDYSEEMVIKNDRAQVKIIGRDPNISTSQIIKSVIESCGLEDMKCQEDKKR